MSSKDEGYTGGTWLQPWGRRERRMAKGIERARRKQSTEREIFQHVGEEPFERCPGCGERYCDGCRSFGIED